MIIQNPIKGKVNFNPYPFQQELIDSILDGKNVIVKSSRQMGTSTTLFYCIRELCLRNPGYKALLVTSHGYGSIGLNKFIDDSEIEKRTKYTIGFRNGSKIEFLPGNPIIGRNFDDYEVFFDLYEFISKELLTNLMQCFSENGFKPRFYSFTGNNDFNRDGFIEMKWNWDLHPNRNEDWKNEQIHLLGEKVFNREIEVI